ncbi:MAG TPA: DUF3261 domain-containing protein [Gammaproteobacteria bacterium]|nr:DUF3261 domain-containing protein [Gammaproteobacteria bacterium]
MNRRACLLLLPLLALFAGCASAPATPDCTLVGRSGRVCLLAPAALPAVRATHIVEIRRNGHEDTFLGQLQIDAHALRLAGTSLFGINLFTIVYDGHTIDSQPPQMKLHPGMLVVMLELTLADPAELENRLHNLTLKVHTSDHGQVRELFERGHLIARIERSDAALAAARINIEIPADKLSVQMTPIPSGTAQP